MSRLLEYLLATGHASDTPATRRAQVRPCDQLYRDPERPAARRTRCHTPVLAGLDADVCAFDVVCDLDPLTALGEALSLLERRRTYTLRREGGGWVLDPRDEHAIADAPAGTGRRADVLASHVCGRPLPPGIQASSTFLEVVTPRPPADAAPPF